MVSHKRQPQTVDPLLGDLCRLYGVQTGYRDYQGRPRESPVQSIVLVLRALGAQLGDREADPHGSLASNQLETAIRERQRKIWSRPIEPVIVAWEGRLPPITVRLPAGGSKSARAELTLTLEDGSLWSGRPDLASLRTLEAAASGREHFEARRLPIARVLGIGSESNPLPWGYHRLRIDLGKMTTEATVLSAPRHCWGGESWLSEDIGRERSASADPSGGYSASRRLTACSDEGDPRDAGGSRTWGIFAPVYALKSERNWGAGDLADLDGLGRLVADTGGRVVSTLPLLASFLDRPFEPAPYRPISRLFWNEFYLAVDQIPEWEVCATAREVWDSSRIQARVNHLKAEPLVDYREVMALKRRVLEELSSCFFSRAEVGRMDSFSRYLATRPDVEIYSEFRAGVEAAGEDWRSWGTDAFVEEPRRPPRTATSGAKSYHMFCQWQLEEQMARLNAGSSVQPSVLPDDEMFQMNRPKAGLLLDLPLGVHPGGYDTWRWRGMFMAGVSAGAPPDAFFSLGQDWSIPPLNPERMREEGHEYFVGSVRHHMRHARYLRVDHIMSLHRLFWVPSGSRPEDGAYVNYPATELYAALAIESHRNRTVVIGEDLGTVPAGVRASMRRHGILGTWVMQTSLRSRGRRLAAPVPSNVVASINTHDMFPFAGFLRGDDIAARLETRQIDRLRADSEMAARKRLVTRLAELEPLNRVPCVSSSTKGSGLDWASEQAGVLGTHDLRAEKLFLRALEYLMNSAAAIVLVNLEDLLLETYPQNMPGTGAERGNWRRRAGGSEADVRRALMNNIACFRLRST